ncbi:MULTISPECIES: serine/threonine-protein kinase [Bacillus cereus group]|uniref:serine/threonine-protein kinase n=1 Tax=Bacillus cereus group TaxID=86661 RepID=UPI0006981605|nr:MULTISPECIES: serine/threonine-protein kinase [Bacillus cereus group]PGU99388.1 serine/threonine protein kinase [Bacillus thuringiensis]
MSAPTLSNIEVHELVQHLANISEIEFLNAGGQKAVYTCRIDGQLYTLKFIDITKNIGPSETESQGIETEILARASRELDIMDKCNSENLVKMGPVGLHILEHETQKLLCFSEEYIEGDDLHTILQRQPYSQGEAIQLGIDIANAIEQLWTINMVHRDIKPKNIMRKTDGSHVLLDTGIAFDVHGPALTQAFHLVGTKIYMSPEQIINTKTNLDFRSDLFLLGIVMYEALCGNHPFYKRGMETYQIFTGITHNAAVPLTQYEIGIHPKLNRIVMRLLSKQPHLRYKSCQSLITQLEELRGEL